MTQHDLSMSAPLTARFLLTMLAGFGFVAFDTIGDNPIAVTLSSAFAAICFVRSFMLLNDAADGKPPPSGDTRTIRIGGPHRC